MLDSDPGDAAYTDDGTGKRVYFNHRYCVELESNLGDINAH